MPRPGQRPGEETEGSQPMLTSFRGGLVAPEHVLTTTQEQAEYIRNLEGTYEQEIP